MRNTAAKRLGGITVLSLLALLAIAVGAQAALAADLSSTPSAGTEGRDGAPLVSDKANLVLLDTIDTDGYVLLAKDGVPRPVTGAASTSFSVWVTVGIALAVLLVVIAAWASGRRRTSRAEEESTVAYCGRHPDDGLCVTA